jgi:hypothetical protein
VKTGAPRSGKTYGDYFLLPKRLLDRRGREGLNVMLGSTKGTLTRNLILPMQPCTARSWSATSAATTCAVLFGQPCHCLARTVYGR